MLQPGDVVTAEFVGATGTKRRPCIVVSTSLYHSHHRDVLLTILTTQVQAATGLTSPSAMRVYLGTRLQTQTTYIGHLSDRDWQQVQARLQNALAVNVPE